MAVLRTLRSVAVVFALVWSAACGGPQADTLPGADGGGPGDARDAGVVPDAGPAADGGGPAVDAGRASDAGEGGLDAGGFDAGGFDAGGFDAGGLDAGGLDAGGFDAGGFDAGTSDAGTSDGGTSVDGGAAGCVTLARLVAPATAAAPSVVVTCDLTLTGAEVITKRLIFQGAASSGVTLRCNGARLDGAAGTVNAGKDMIEIRSRKVTDGGVTTWEPVEGVTIHGCDVTGSVRIWGMGTNGQGADLLLPSRDAGYVDLVRGNAPRNILVDHVTIRGTGRNPFYVAPGVSGVTLRDSEITGTSAGGAIYLDAESTGNTFLRNRIHPVTQSRELVSIDASSHNRFLENWFSSLGNGGIYLYRNCGEGGVIRHTAPQHNVIVNNGFYYSQYAGSSPAVFIGSRNAVSGVSFCDADDGSPLGSSASDLDYARHNVVMQNQVRTRAVSDMIVIGAALFDPLANWPNSLGHNVTVAELLLPASGCFLPTRFDRDFLLHGDSVDAVEPATGACRTFTCAEGTLIAGAACTTSAPVAFSCQGTGLGGSCSGTASCPGAARLIAATAVCDLARSTLPGTAEVDAAPRGELAVPTAPDFLGSGECRVGQTAGRSEHVIIRGSAGSSVSFGCSGQTLGSGCAVRGVLTCQP